MPSYLAAWLFWAGLPFGALPIVMLVDLSGPGAGYALDVALRRLLWLAPIAALLLIPVLAAPQSLYGWAGGHGFSTPFGRTWMTHGPFIWRSIIELVLWAGLAAYFSRPPRLHTINRRRFIAAWGLLIYALTITTASADWAMAVEPNWTSAIFGFLFAASQITIAVAAATLLCGADWRVAVPEAPAAFLMAATTLWLFFQFIQFLVVWSGDKPNEIIWYLHRGGLGSTIAICIALLAGVAAPLVMLLSWRLRRHPRILPVSAMLVLLSQALGMLWLITPSFRRHFAVDVMDILLLAGLGALACGVCLLPGPVRHPILKGPTHA
ncbi:MAG: hypothetical protein INR62_11360 [Rhodospirillales bacterium]|nr:hypothetical protein [Acetobacter sp.]